MTISELVTLAMLLNKWVAQEPLSHRKRDVIHQICYQIHISILRLLDKDDGNTDIPF